MDQNWLAWAQRVRAIAQTGTEYAGDPYDQERYAELHELSEQMLAALTGRPPEVIHNLYIPEKGYPTPKVDVRAGVVSEGRILLVRETSDGRWAMPGGWGDEHDSPAGSVVREVREESGFEVRVIKLVAVKDRHLHPYTPPRLERIYKMIFLCELTGGEAQLSIETSGVEFFAPDALPELSLGRTLPADVELVLAHESDVSLPTYCD